MGKNSEKLYIVARKVGKKPLRKEVTKQNIHFFSI